MSSNGFQNSGYSNERPPSSTGSGEADLATDPASSSFFANDFKKHEDLKQMLDGNKDTVKLEAMKRIIGMVAKGKDASDLFPAVVKNVVSKNLEIKKLVYVYLTRYAEEQQDLALLSVSTFQRALKDPNQLIRASALRVLSSIRVPMIAPIMMLAIKEAVMDMSPYVRKTVAHAIPKLYSLDPEQKDQLIEIIEKLLGDKTTLVIGSAIQAFEEVCPERIDLIHKNYRKMCNLLVDVEEWGQVVLINMLTRYCRSQFASPNQDENAEEADRPFYEDSDEKGDDSPEKDEEEEKKKVYVMDPDHRLLLRQVKPLLNSRNAAVVMAVAQLYHHCAPKSEVGLVARSMIRLLRGHKEVQYVVLSNIATMSIKRKGMFEPYLKSFYVRSNDPTHVKLLKLEILTNLATETNISTILRELQTYVTSSDNEFAAATIQAIGRCASSIKEVTDTCLNGLVHLMSNRDETVVAESVVVIKKLLQMQPSEHKEIIIHMAKMIDKITVPMARASILWLIGEYSERVPKIAPDVLRKMAKTFISEEDIVKLQILNLAAKLCVTNTKQTVCKLLCQYVFNLAKYDQNYDIRDRSRFLRQLIFPGDKGGELSKKAKKIFLSTKPAPVLESTFKDRDAYQLGTLSHVLNCRATGYQELPEWPQTPPDPSVRNVEVTMPWTDSKPLKSKKAQKKKSFYSDSESSPEDDSDKSSEDSSDSSDDSDSSEDSSSESESEVEDSDLEAPDSDSEEDKPKIKSAQKKSKVASPVKSVSSSGEESSEEASSSEEESSSEESSDEKEKLKRKPPPKVKEKSSTKKASKESEPNLLLDLDDLGPSTMQNGGTPTVQGNDILTPMLASEMDNLGLGDATVTTNMMAPPVQVKTKSYELLNRMSGNGLALSYKFTRTISIFSPKMASIELSFVNNSDKPLKEIHIGDKKLQSGMEMQDFPEIANLGPGASTTVLTAVNFNDTTQPAKFELVVSEQKFNLSISAPVGELLVPHTMNEKGFLTQQAKLSGMNENTGTAKIAESNISPSGIYTCVMEVANVLQVPSSEENVYRFAAKTLSLGCLTLVSVKVLESQAKVTVNCEKMVIGSMLVKDIKGALEKGK
ncbi:AP-3 complex subunit beta-2-like isoform X2 [Liolophura sinensis]|uniref:AP-3 complex subunit beta-2-like isoform X2 n=1 Tax=Liolophura sinensis TaxID=3198878 RepID=UPI0031592FD2